MFKQLYNVIVTHTTATTMPVMEEESPPPPTLRFEVKRVADLPIFADVHLPLSARLPERHNALLYIHGGAFCAMDSTVLPDFLLRWVHRVHTVVVSATYRLSPQAKLRRIVDDVRDCLTQVAAGVNIHGSLSSVLGEQKATLTGNVAVLGGSAGGWLALLLASLCHPAVKVAAAMYHIENEYYRKPWDMPNKIKRDTIQAFLDESAEAGAEPDFNYRTGAISGRHNVTIYMAQNALWRSWLLDPMTGETFDMRRRVTPQWPPVFFCEAKTTRRFGRATPTTWRARS